MTRRTKVSRIRPQRLKYNKMKLKPIKPKDRKSMDLNQGPLKHREAIRKEEE